MQTIGLATCFLNNYGACLQAHALQQVINQFDYSCEIIQYTEPYGYPHRATIRGKLKENRIFRYIYSMFSFDYKERYLQDNLFRKFRADYLNIAKYDYKTTEEIMANPPIYDAYVCGSDQIWNPEFYNGNNKVYFLSFAPCGKKRIAYAPSIGLTDFPEKYAKEFKTLVESLDVVSVREREGLNIVHQLTSKPARVVLDPTLLCNGFYWEKLCLPIKQNKSFIFFYTFGDKPYMHEWIDRVKKETGLPVLYTSFTTWGAQIEGSRCVDPVGPCEFLWLIRNAKLVVTDSFHATAFSINFNTPFYTMLRNDKNDSVNMNSRIYNLLEMTDLNNRIIDKSNFKTEGISTQMNFVLANKKLEERRKTDLAFLRSALQ